MRDSDYATGEKKIKILDSFHAGKRFSEINIKSLKSPKQENIFINHKNSPGSAFIIDDDTTGPMTQVSDINTNKSTLDIEYGSSSGVNMNSMIKSPNAKIFSPILSIKMNNKLSLQDCKKTFKEGKNSVNDPTIENYSNTFGKKFSENIKKKSNSILKNNNFVKKIKAFAKNMNYNMENSTTQNGSNSVLSVKSDEDTQNNDSKSTTIRKNKQIVGFKAAKDTVRYKFSQNSTSNSTFYSSIDPITIETYSSYLPIVSSDKVLTIQKIKTKSCLNLEYISRYRQANLIMETQKPNIFQNRGAKSATKLDIDLDLDHPNKKNVSWMTKSNKSPLLTQSQNKQRSPKLMQNSNLSFNLMQSQTIQSLAHSNNYTGFYNFSNTIQSSNINQYSSTYRSSKTHKSSNSNQSSSVHQSKSTNRSSNFNKSSFQIGIRKPMVFRNGNEKLTSATRDSINEDFGKLTARTKSMILVRNTKYPTCNTLNICVPTNDNESSISRNLSRSFKTRTPSFLERHPSKDNIAAKNLDRYGHTFDSKVTSSSLMKFLDIEVTVSKKI